MNTQKRALLAAIPLRRLDLSTKNGLREWRRRQRRKASDWGRAWEHQTERPVGKHRLKNNLGHRPRWRWVPKEKAV